MGSGAGMKCEHCGASNLDGAERCSACGELLESRGYDASGSRTSGSRSGWIIGAVVAIASVGLVAAMLSAGGGGAGGSGGVMRDDASMTSSDTTAGAGDDQGPVSQVTTLPVTPEQEDALRRAADAAAADDYLEYVGGAVSVSRYEFGGHAYGQIRMYPPGASSVPTSGEQPTVHVVVIINEETGEATVHESD